MSIAAIEATIFFIFMAVFLILGIKSGIKTNRLTKRRLKFITLFTGIICIFLGILSINSVLLIITPRVSGDLKDGLFGAAGGIIYGVSLFSVMSGATLIGLFWGKNYRDETNKD